MKISYKPTPPAPESFNSTNLRIRLVAILWISLADWLLLILLATLLISFGDPPLRPMHAGNILSFASIVSVSIGAVMVIWWAYVTVRRPLRLEDEERNRRWDIEDEDREAAQSFAETLTDPDEPIELGRITTTAFLLLQRHAQGQPVTRAACVPGITSIKYWTLAMDTFKAMGWRKGYKLSAPPDLNQSWPQFNAATYMANDRFWVRQDGQDLEIA